MGTETQKKSGLSAAAAAALLAMVGVGAAYGDEALDGAGQAVESSAVQSVNGEIGSFAGGTISMQENPAEKGGYVVSVAGQKTRRAGSVSCSS